MKQLITMGITMGLLLLGVACSDPQPTKRYLPPEMPRGKIVDSNARIAIATMSSKPNLMLRQSVEPDFKTMRLEIHTGVYDLDPVDIKNWYPGEEPPLLIYTVAKMGVDTSEAEEEKKRQWEMCQAFVLFHVAEVRQRQDSMNKEAEQRNRKTQILAPYLAPYVPPVR